MYVICHVTSQDHLREDSFEFMGGSSSKCVTTLTCLVNIIFVIVGYNIFNLSLCIIWPQV